MRRFFRYSLRSLFILVTLLSIYFAWRLVHARERQRAIANQLVDTALISMHWQSLETNKKFQTIIASLQADLASNAASKLGFLLPNGTFKDGKKADEFEMQFLRDVTAVPVGQRGGAAETAERSFRMGSYRYYRAIRAEKSCVVCHRMISKDPALVEGDLLAVVRIELED